MHSRYVSLRSVTVPCTLALQEAVTALCARTGTDPSVLARAGLLLVQERPELAVPDPGSGSFERAGHASASGERSSRLWLPRLRLSAPSRSTPEELRIALASLLMDFANERGLTPELVTERCRQLARIFHPDTGIAADSSRMAQLTAARGVLM